MVAQSMLRKLPMGALEFRNMIAELDLSQVEAARLLSVNDRTVRRWAEGISEIPGPVEQALLAWVRLDRVGLPWRPDEITLASLDEEEVAKQISLHRQHVLDLDSVLRRVSERGGPAAPWKVDLRERRASLGPLEVRFYPMPNGQFSPSNYRRKDSLPDIKRDQPLLEDAYSCIANEIARTGPDWVNET